MAFMYVSLVTTTGVCPMAQEYRSAIVEVHSRVVDRRRVCARSTTSWNKDDRGKKRGNSRHAGDLCARGGAHATANEQHESRMKQTGTKFDGETACANTTENSRWFDTVCLKGTNHCTCTCPCENYFSIDASIAASAWLGGLKRGRICENFFPLKPPASSWIPIVRILSPEDWKQFVGCKMKWHSGEPSDGSCQ